MANQEMRTTARGEKQVSRVMAANFVFTILIVPLVLVSSWADASNEPLYRDKPVDVKASFEPKSTRVAIMPVMNEAIETMKPFESQEITENLSVCHQFISDLFTKRGFIVISPREASGSTRLTTSNESELAKRLNADLIVECGVEKQTSYTRINVLGGVLIGAWKKGKATAGVRMYVYSVEHGSLINDRFTFTSSRGRNHGEIKRRALLLSADLALKGLLQPYPVLSKEETTSRNGVRKEAEADTAKVPLQGIDMAEKKPEPPVVVKVSAPVTPPAPVQSEVVPSAPPQPQVTKGPKYLMINGYSLVPLKSIAEWLGATIDFDRNSGIITIKTGSNIVSIKLNADVASVNGKLVQLQTSAIERNGSTYVPLRFLGEAFAAKVKFDAVTGEIRIENPSGSAVLVLTK